MKDSLTRRDLLRGAASVGGLGGVASLAGCMAFDGGASMGEASPTMSPPSLGGLDVVPVIDPSSVEGRFGELVDLVEDYGADPTGDEPINAALESAWADDTLIVLPEGEYKMNRKFRRTSGSNVGLIGQNAIIRHGEVEAINGHLVVQGEYTGGTMLFRFGTSTNPLEDGILFGGFIFDWSWSENAGMQALNAFVGGESEIRNIIFNGVHSLGTHGNMRVATASPDAVAIVDSVDMRSGGLHFRDTINTRITDRFDESTRFSFGQSWSTTGITGHPDQQGTTVFRRVFTGPWPDNAIYVRGGSGRKIVSECAAWNGGGCQIRTNGGNEWEPLEWVDGTEDKDEALEGAYPGSVVENSACVIDQKPESVYISPRGILLQDGPQIVRNCEVEIAYSEGGGAGGTYGVGTRGEGGAKPAGPAVVENTTITLHEDTDAVYVSPYTNSIEAHDIAINTVGWEGSLNRLVGGVGVDQLEGVTLNGEPLV